MNNLYHKVAVASICTALGFTLVPNKEAKAATFNLTGTSFSVSEGSLYVERGSVKGRTILAQPVLHPETRAFYEFDIGNLSLAPNTSIKSAILNTPFINLKIDYRWLYLDIYGYVGNGRPDLSDFNAGVKIAYENATLYSPYPSFPRFGEIKFDVTNFVKERVSNGDAFAGLGIRVGRLPLDSAYPNGGSVDLRSYYGDEPTLTIETVPEPTTIFGSALALGVGGWLKRKKSSQQSKTTSQH